MRTPGNDFELAAGFLHAEGMIRDISQIRRMGRPSGPRPSGQRGAEEDDRYGRRAGSRRWVVHPLGLRRGKRTLWIMMTLWIVTKRFLALLREI